MTGGRSTTRAEDNHFRRAELRRELGNFSLLRSRHCVGQIVSMHQSGTHWVKFMLANALTAQYELPPPQFNHANDIIGGPKDAIIYPNLPRLIASHSMPQRWVVLPVVRTFLPFPRYVLLVRDIRASLVSNYRKWQTRYDEPFSTYLRGDPSGKRYNSDIWWNKKFLNAWRRFLLAHPDRVCTIRYEEVSASTAEHLQQISEFLKLELSSNAIQAGVDAGSREVMAQRDDPNRPPGAVQSESVDWRSFYTDDDRRWFELFAHEHLVDSYGYDYTTW